MRSFSTFLLLLALAPPAAAQERGEIRGYLGAGMAASRVHGDVAPFIEIEAGLDLSENVRVGGAGYFLPSSLDIGSVALQDLRLDFGYGGLVLEVLHPSRSGNGAWFARLLVGAGNAVVRDAATSLRLDSDNFVVLQPGVGVAYPLHGRLSGAVGLSWRWVAGVQDLRGVDPSDLRSPSFDLRLRISSL